MRRCYTIGAMRNKTNKISELLLNVISEFYENDSKVRTFGTDTELYHSEINMIDYIKKHPNLHISGVARDLGVTRGAVSQTVLRLERKQMIVKEASPENSAKIIMRLTPKGEAACLDHEQGHKMYSAVISEILSKSEEDQLAFLEDFLSQFKNAIRKN